MYNLCFAWCLSCVQPSTRHSHLYQKLPSITMVTVGFNYSMASTVHTQEFQISSMCSCVLPMQPQNQRTRSITVVGETTLKSYMTTTSLHVRCNQPMNNFNFYLFILCLVSLFFFLIYIYEVYRGPINKASSYCEETMTTCEKQGQNKF